MSYGQQRPHCKSPHLLLLLLCIYSEQLPCCFKDCSKIIPASEAVGELGYAVINASYTHTYPPAYAGRVHPLLIEQIDEQASCIHHLLMAVFRQNKFGWNIRCFGNNFQCSGKNLFHFFTF